MYQRYWGLARSPFDSVPDPGMYFSDHPTVESAVAELLFAIEEGNECLAVVVGEVGLGKTMALRVVLDSLDPELYRIAFVTNPAVTFVQLLREIIGQLQGRPCTLRSRELLLEEFNRLLFQTADEGRKVLVFIDEGNAMKGANLEALRLLTNMQEDTRNLMAIILAGQPKLARMLEDPRRANLFQRIGIYTRLEPLDSVETVRRYVEHRLQQAGAVGRIFDDSSFEVIYRYSQGIPRLINRLCKLSMKAGETNHLSIIGADVVEAVATRFESHHRGRNKAKTAGGPIRRTAAEPQPVSVDGSSVPAPDPQHVPVTTALEDGVESAAAAESIPVPAPAFADAVEPPAEPGLEPSGTTGERSCHHESPPAAGGDHEPETEAIPAEEPPSRAAATSAVGTEPPPVPTAEEAKPVANRLSSPVVVNVSMDAAITDSHEGNGRGRPFADQEAPSRPAPVIAQLIIPREVIEALRSLADERQQLRLAGQLAARQIQEHPERYTDAFLDPVRAWDLLRNEILRAARCA
jgi:general secretion pathway protein A